MIALNEREIILLIALIFKSESDIKRKMNGGGGAWLPLKINLKKVIDDKFK